MELIKEITKQLRLTEDLNSLAKGSNYTVYKATGPNTAQVYYGYVKGTGDEAIRTAFFTAGERAGEGEEKRGVQVLIRSNGGANDIEFEEVETTDTEEHAFMLRNEERQADSMSVTGPSVFPPFLHRAGMEKHPEIAERIKKKQVELSYAKQLPKILKNLYSVGRNIRALNAYARDFYNNEQLQALFANNPQARAELKTLNPEEFAQKYNIQFVNSKK